MEPEIRTKYPRTYHLPFSPGRGKDDKVMWSVDHLVGLPLTITEKMDGSNVCMTNKECFSRSHSGPPTHESFNGFKALHSTIKNLIRDDILIFGEWCFAKHSISYDKLPAYFLLFGVKDTANNEWGSWQDVELFAQHLGVRTVPVIEQEIVFKTAKELEQFVTYEANKQSLCGNDREGLVVRKRLAFDDKEFSTMMAKYVRKNHVQTTTHWKFQQLVRNELKR
jgi:hypothetical protein